MKKLFYITYSHLLVFFRNKTALFFFCIFPIILFSIFGSLWGFNSGYIFFLLSGVIGMNILSDGLSSVGPIVKDSHESGLIRYLKKQSFNPILYFVGFIICRIIILLFVMSLLCLTAFLLFSYEVSKVNILFFICGIFVGMFIFSFIGLVITYSGVKRGSNSSIINIISYIILFSSNVFYESKHFNKTIGIIGDSLPLNPILEILRKGYFDPILSVWIIVPAFVFLLMLNKIKLSR